ncbi:hypothetical protein [Streptomyces sp. NPDC055134]
MGSPLEAIDSRTIAPGKVGQKTAWSQGTPDPVPVGS